MITDRVPGLAFAVVQDQEVVHACGMGVTSVEHWGYPVTSETIFRIGSITKALTGSAILRLVDAGKIDLDAPVTTYAPWLNIGEPGTPDSITVLMLMTHTSGLPTEVIERGDRDPEGLARFLRNELPHYSLVAPPGMVFNYSNLGFSLLGHIAEVVTGQTYQDLMDSLVFTPLHMSYTTFDPTLAMSFPLSQSHRLSHGGEPVVVRPFADCAAFTPAGFAYSNVIDLSRFAQMLLSKGLTSEGQFIRSDFIEQMLTLQVPTFTPGAGGRGLALFVDPHPRSGLDRIGHMGGISGYKALFELYPTVNSAVVLLMNRAGASGKIRDIIMEECIGVKSTEWQPVFQEPDRCNWQFYVGIYLHDGDGFGGLAVVTVEGDRLLMSLNGQRLEMNCLGPGHYVSRFADGSYLGAGFMREPGGSVCYLMLSETPFHRIIQVNTEVEPSTWERYVGAYSLKQPPMIVRVANGTLFLYSAFYRKEVSCVPLSNNEFACEWGRFSFRVNVEGKVDGIIWAGERFIPRLGQEQTKP